MSLKSEDPRGMSPRDSTTGGPFDSEPIAIEGQPYGPVKEEPQDVRSTRKPKVGTGSRSAGQAPMPISTESFDIASSRTASRKSSRGSLSGGTERSRSPSVVVTASHRGQGAIAASPLHVAGRSSPVLSCSAAEESLAAATCGASSGQDGSSPSIVRGFDLKVWEGMLPEKFVNKDDVDLWEARVQEKVHVLLSEKQEQMKMEANAIMNNFEQRAQLYESEARKLVAAGEQRVKNECQNEFTKYMGEAHREVVSTKSELRRVTGEAQVRTDQAQAALSDAASARNDLQSALSLVQEQSHRTSSLEVHAEKYFQDLTVPHKHKIF